MNNRVNCLKFCANNLTERQLRPAVISRKVSCGNKTPEGTRTWETFSSQAATCPRRGQLFVDTIARAAPLPQRQIDTVEQAMELAAGEKDAV